MFSLDLLAYVYVTMTSRKESSCFSLVDLLELKFLNKNWHPWILTSVCTSTKDSSLLHTLKEKNKPFIPIQKSFSFHENVLAFRYCLAILLIWLYTDIQLYTYVSSPLHINDHIDILAPTFTYICMYDMPLCIYTNIKSFLPTFICIIARKYVHLKTEELYCLRFM